MPGDEENRLVMNPEEDFTVADALRELRAQLEAIKTAREYTDKQFRRQFAEFDERLRFIEQLAAAGQQSQAKRN